jgi:hypothetical protein
MSLGLFLIAAGIAIAWAIINEKPAPTPPPPPPEPKPVRPPPVWLPPAPTYEDLLYQKLSAQIRAAKSLKKTRDRIIAEDPDLDSIIIQGRSLKVRLDDEMKRKMNRVFHHPDRR